MAGLTVLPEVPSSSSGDRRQEWGWEGQVSRVGIGELLMVNSRGRRCHATANSTHPVQYSIKIFWRCRKVGTTRKEQVRSRARDH